MLIRIIVLLGLVLVTSGGPTMYKKNDQNIYEPDLVAVSSTVIPEVEIKSEALVDQMDMEYKKAYLKLFGKKKYSERFEKPDTLFTDKKKFDKKSRK